MARIRVRGAALAGLGMALLAAAGAGADEGMWLINRPPAALLKSTYGFEPTAPWLEHLQKSAVRFSTGGSGSIVSRDGLVMTNHHVGSDMLAKLSTPDRNLMRDGFAAATRDKELPCPDLELNVLWQITDVTARVTGAATSSMTPAEANTARRKMILTIEKESQDATGMKSEVVTLYRGARYHLYNYKRYTDVRLVFAPEEHIAFFGGDTDNFEYPRYCLDCCFFRIYENGKPLQAEHFLRWSTAGAKDGELTFVVGHPGRTQRLNTMDHLRFLRDVALPARLASLRRSEVLLQTFAGRSAENARIAREDLFGVANARKATTGEYHGLLDPEVMARKTERERALRAAWKASGGSEGNDPWVRLAEAHKAYRAWEPRYTALRALNSELFGHALTVVRLGAELPKPSSDRLREYGDANLASVYLGLYSPAPIHEALEIHKIASGLASLAERLGADDPLVVSLLNGKSPQARAEEVVRGTSLRDVSARKALVEGGRSAIEASNDPMIRLARAFDPESRALRTRYENEVEPVERDVYAAIAAAKFAAEGEETYPDATFTLRLSYGPVKGYTENGVAVPPFTTFEGLYKRAEERKGEEGFELPQRWWDRRSKINMSVPFNFVHTPDIIGGNSGSPVVNAAGELVGLIFDGNIQSLVWSFAFDEAQARSVSVDSRGMLEAFRSVYDADWLVRELTGAP